MLHPLIEESGANISTRFKFTGKIKADPKKLARVFENVIENAIKFSDEQPSITITTKSEGDYVSILIKDEGVGIDRKELSKVFKRFYRARSSEGVNGTGLGLSIVKKIVEDHQGDVKIKSKKGYGTEVRIRLPFQNGSTITKDNSRNELTKQIKNEGKKRGHLSPKGQN